jgi:antitoxin HigA-1
MKLTNGRRPVHPGEVLRENFLRPARMSATALAKALRVPAARISEILRERRGISADMAIRLARYFHGEAQAWMNLQARYDLRLAEIANGRRIRSEVKPSRS